MRIPALLSILFSFAAASLHAGPLTEARINKIINEVSVVQPDAEHPARLNEVVTEEVGVKTGVKSRSELLFQDNTLTRIGAESYFSFKPGTRDITLQQGTMLLQVPKGLGGAKIRTAAVTAAITGTTILLENVPNKMIKVLVLEGSLRLSVNGTIDRSVLLLPGKMVTMPPDAKEIPAPVSFNLAQVMKASPLVTMDGESKPLPSLGLIEKEIEAQAESAEDDGLSFANIVTSEEDASNDGVLEGVPSDSYSDSSSKGAEARRASNGPRSSGNATPTSAPLPSPASATTPNLTATPQPTATPSATASAQPAASPVATATPQPTATPALGGSPTPTPRPSATPRPDDDGDDSDEDDDKKRKGKDDEDKRGKTKGDEASSSARRAGPGRNSSRTPVGFTARRGALAGNSAAEGTTTDALEPASDQPRATNRFRSESAENDSDRQRPIGKMVKVADSEQLLSLLNNSSTGANGVAKVIPPRRGSEETAKQRRVDRHLARKTDRHGLPRSRPGLVNVSVRMKQRSPSPAHAST
nr:FecR domain-containing protein [Chthoniobacterales bacterium]